MKKIFILLGHPDKDGTISNEFANAYEEAAKAAGHEVRRTNLGELQFDPILHKGYRAIQELEPDLKKIQEDIRWCEHFVLVYPLWWSGTPALLKGMVDRMWLPGFGFRFKKMNGTKRLIGWEKLLKGRTSRVIVSSKNFPILEEFMYGDGRHRECRTSLLRFQSTHFKSGRLRKPFRWSEKNVVKKVRRVWQKRTIKGSVDIC
jgi:putative NADPH-quinone reductase